jgi:hypothetical protein
MLITAAVIFWFLCGLLAIYLAFGTARRHQEVFDPIHIWLAMLGPVSLIFVCFTFADGKRAPGFPG